MSQDDDVAAAMECLKIEDGRVVPISPAALSPSRVAAAGGDEGVDVGPGPAAVQHASASLADVTNLGSKSLLPKQHPQEGPWVSAETSRSTVFPDVTPSTHESRGGEGRPQLGPSTAAVQVVGPHLDAAGPAGTPPQARGPAADKAIAGLGPALELLRQAILWPLLYAAEAQHLGLKWPRGVLLHGPPGCGKTSLVCAVAAEAGAIVQPVSASSIFGPYQGQSEQRLREAFEKAERDAVDGQAVVLFLDEVDALCPPRSRSGLHESRVVGQLLTLLDGAAKPRETKGRVAVVAATNRPNALDPALRRPGRLDREILVPIPDLQARTAILRLHAASLPLAADLDLGTVAASCHGYSGADLAALCREAAMAALTSVAAAFLDGEEGAEEGLSGEDLEPITLDHFREAMKAVGPSINRGAHLDLPPVTWEEIGGLAEVKRRLQQAVEWPLKYPDAFERLGINPPGVSSCTVLQAAARRVWQGLL